MNKLKLNSLIVALGLMVSSAFSQTIVTNYITEDSCYPVASGQGVCVEVTETNKGVATLYCVKEGRSTLNFPIFGLRLFSCTNVVELPEYMGVKWVNGYPLKYWKLPVYTGLKEEILSINKNTRIMGVPKGWPIPYYKVYQMRPTDTLALVFKNNKYISHYYNPKATQKYPKSSLVVIVIPSVE